jgi:hypothetical protein
MLHVADLYILVRERTQKISVRGQWIYSVDKTADLDEYLGNHNPDNRQSNPYMTTSSYESVPRLRYHVPN